MIGIAFKVLAQSASSHIQWTKNPLKDKKASRAAAYIQAKQMLTKRKTSKYYSDNMLPEERSRLRNAKYNSIKAANEAAELVNQGKISMSDWFRTQSVHSVEAEKNFLELMEYFDQPEKPINVYKGANRQRTAKKLSDLMYLNIHKYAYLVTLTWEVEPENWNAALVMVQAYCRKLKIEIDEKSLYIYAPELGGKGGRLHVHMVVAGDIRNIENELKKYWKHGICDVERIRKNNGEYDYMAVAQYITKYITKENCELIGNRRGYYISHGWKDAYMNYEGTEEKKLELQKKIRAWAEKRGGYKENTYQIQNDDINLLISKMSVNGDVSDYATKCAKELGMEIEERGILRKTKQQKYRDKLQEAYWNLLFAYHTKQKTAVYENRLFTLLTKYIGEEKTYNFIRFIKAYVLPNAYLLSAGTYDNEEAIDRVLENGMQSIRTDEVSIDMKEYAMWKKEKLKWRELKHSRWLKELAEEALYDDDDDDDEDEEDEGG